MKRFAQPADDFTKCVLMGSIHHAFETVTVDVCRMFPFRSR